MKLHSPLPMNYRVRIKILYLKVPRIISIVCLLFKKDTANLRKKSTSLENLKLRDKSVC